jgi:hypothetical protein
MASTPVNLGYRLNDEVYVFRAFAEKNYRDRKKNEFRYFAYLLRDDDTGDGLSVGLSPSAAVKHLQTNEGYCRILVGAIHALPYGLLVRIDAVGENHAFICNLPLMTISDDSRVRARLISGELARRSEVITCDSYIPPTAA